jgi:uncharacterized protein involved in outer membrane biogenesis
MKKLILLVGVVVIVIIIILAIGVSNIGPLIKNAVNTYGPNITKTDVRLEDVDVSILSGKAKLKGFYLGNPQGFNSPEAVKVGSIFVNVDVGSLTKDTIIIDRINVVRPEITYEKTRRSDNFKTIIDNVKKAVGPGKSPKEKSEMRGEGKKLLIRDFIVKEGKVTLFTSLLGEKSVSAPLPDIHLKDIGGETEGTSPAKAFKEILTALRVKITSPAVINILDEGVKADVKKQLEKVSDKVKGLFGK